MAAPSIPDLQDQARTVHLVERPDLEGDAGDISIMLQDRVVAMADVGISVSSAEFAAQFLDGARGDKLTELADDRYQVQRDEASQAIGQVTFTRGAGAPITILAGTRVATAVDIDGTYVEFTTDVDLVFAAELSLSVNATAVNGGREGNVAAGAITRILDTLAQSFTVTNAAAFVGGNPEQDDDSLIQECRDTAATRQRGTKAAIELGAKQVPQVDVATPVVVNGVPTVYISDADGGGSLEMAVRVDAELESWQGFGIDVEVVVATLLSQAVSVQLTVRSGVEVAALALRVRQAIVAAVNRLAVGETLRRGLIEQAIRNVDRDAITEVTFITPTADIAPSASELIRTTMTLVSVV